MQPWESCFKCLLSSSLIASFFCSSVCARSMPQPDPAFSSGVFGGLEANTDALPKAILKTGVNLTSQNVSPKTLQLADILKMTVLLEQIEKLRRRVSEQGSEITLENLALRQELNDNVVKAIQEIQKADLEVDFTLAQIEAEQTAYSVILANYQNVRDKAVARTNAASFYANGALWAVTEALAIPCWNRPRFAIPSGTMGILAGVVPSALSLYAMRQFNGRSADSVAEPNMLAKLFDLPTTQEIEYPQSIYDFLNSVPPKDPTGKTRRDQLIERWMRDQNIPNFTDRRSKKQLEIVTASVHRKGELTIDVLTTRLAMLQQLGAEVLRMKRLLLELSMVVNGNKHL